MKTDETTETDVGGGRARVRWQKYTLRERVMLDGKFLGDWENLDFMRVFWNPIWDQRDIVQYRRLAQAWRLRHQGSSFNDISKELAVDTGKACALVSGKNLRPYLAQMYLNCEMLAELRHGWKWTLQTTPKPTNPYPTAYRVPETISEYSDIVEFLGQFPPLPESNQNIPFFGVTSAWVEQHKPKLFGLLLGFLVGDAGKYYPEYETRARHYAKSAITTNMANIDSNFRLLRYVQMAQDCIGIRSHQISGNGIIRWNSESSNLVTWMIRACLGLEPGERTSRNPINMPWLSSCPREFIIAFLQGLAESDGHVHKTRNYAEIASVPNAKQYAKLFQSLHFIARTYTISRPTTVRTSLQTATAIPLFNPIVRSYRHEKLQARIRKSRNIPPLPSFFLVSVDA